ncbi:MAG: Glycosyl transferase GT4 family [Microgenomates group bacterium GW2011_GWA2_44_7]|nr:MAG: Glycosyl transferase GT4 family [Microgenomates group bacterium GW2011_GWA2_44_7]KKT78388.1 MAG: Glycosyl transferase GT4 family [Microgenomates group bacterium GW2011_GWB1_44_8]
MRIVGFLNAYSQGLSGGDACFLNIAKEIGLKEDLVIVTSKMGRELCEDRAIKAKFIVTSRETKFGNVYFIYLERLLKTFLFLRSRPFKDGVVYASSDFLPDVLPAWLLRKSKHRLWIQKIFHIVPPERIISYLFQKVSLFLIKSADLIITDNQGLKEELIGRHGFFTGQVEFISPGIDLKKIATITPSKERYEGIFVGQLRKSKGVFDLIPIWKKVIKVRPAAKLAVIGKDVGGTEKILRMIIQKEKLEKHIIILGFLPKNEDVYALMKASKVLLLPSYEEGFGMVAAEALSCGIKVVAYRLPALEENFKSVVKMVGVGDVDAFAGELLKVFKGNRPNLNNAKLLVNRFDKIDVINKELTLIKNALKSAR